MHFKRAVNGGSPDLWQDLAVGSKGFYTDLANDIKVAATVQGLLRIFAPRETLPGSLGYLNDA